MVRLFVLWTLFVALANASHHHASRFLKNYVEKDDGMFSWYDTGMMIQDELWTAYMINITSQSWMTPELIGERSIWTHKVLVIVPKLLLNKNKSLLYITGVHNDVDPMALPSKTSEEVIITSLMALTSGIVVSILYQIPNAPITFANDPSHKQRTEDEIIAFTIMEFIHGSEDDDALGDEQLAERLVLWPMVKAGVKAMDAIQEFSRSKLEIEIEGFIVSGASKRGWTTWLVGAVDSRVIAIVPIVFDLLNYGKNLEHHFQSLGGWTFAFMPYWDLNMTGYLHTSRRAKLVFDLVDPLTYKETLTMPKLVVHTTGDEFFLLDDDSLWWGELPGETRRLMVHNAEHTLVTNLPEAVQGMLAFGRSIVHDIPRPMFEWKILEGSGDIVVTTDQKPKEIYLRYATTLPDVAPRRDFRLLIAPNSSDPEHPSCKYFSLKGECLNPCFWSKTSLQPLLISSPQDPFYTYRAFIESPPAGQFSGMVVEAVFSVDNWFPLDFLFTTQASVIPQTLPFAECKTFGGCEAHLV